MMNSEGSATGAAKRGWSLERGYMSPLFATRNPGGGGAEGATAGAAGRWNNIGMKSLFSVFENNMHLMYIVYFHRRKLEFVRIG